MDLNARLDSHVGADTQVAVVTSYARREAQMEADAIELLTRGRFDEWATTIAWLDRVALARRSEAAEHPGWSAQEEWE